MSTHIQKASLRSRIGIGLVVFGFILPIFGLVVPFLDLPTALTATLVALFMVGGPEVFMILGGLLAGKEGIVLVKNKIKRILGLSEGKYAATRGQYNLALFLMVVWFLGITLPYYVPQLSEATGVFGWKWYYHVIGDFIFIIAIAFIGGDQLVVKFGQLFTWEPWELPPKKAE